MKATIFDLSSGEIVRNVECPFTLLSLQCSAGQDYIHGHLDDEKWYLPDGMPAPRPIMAPVVSGTTISNLPVGCRVRVGQEAVVVEDGMLELSFDFPGSYPVKISCYPYLDATVEVTL